MQITCVCAVPNQSKPWEHVGLCGPGAVLKAHVCSVTGTLGEKWLCHPAYKRLVFHSGTLACFDDLLLAHRGKPVHALVLASRQAFIQSFIHTFIHSQKWLQLTFSKWSFGNVWICCAFRLLQWAWPQGSEGAVNESCCGPINSSVLITYLTSKGHAPVAL